MWRKNNSRLPGQMKTKTAWIKQHDIVERTVCWKKIDNTCVRWLKVRPTVMFTKTAQDKTYTITMCLSWVAFSTYYAYHCIDIYAWCLVLNMMLPVSWWQVTDAGQDAGFRWTDGGTSPSVVIWSWLFIPSFQPAAAQYMSVSVHDVISTLWRSSLLYIQGGSKKSKLLILESMKLMLAKHELVSQNLSQN